MRNEARLRCNPAWELERDGVKPRRPGVCFDCANAVGMWHEKCGRTADRLADAPLVRAERQRDGSCGPEARHWQPRRMR